MSDDRELLELAARAAGVDVVQVIYEGHSDVTMDYDKVRSIEIMIGEEYVEWNPLTDDGDALRLAVKLNMAVTIDFDRPTLRVVAGCNGPADSDGACAMENGTDHFAATRRAIVRAAAQIGRQITD